METHADDPIGTPEADSSAEADAWDKMAEQVSSIGRKLRDTYQQSMTETGPDQQEIKAALRTLGNAWEKLAQAVGTAARDEEVREHMKNAATGFFEAVGSAFSELGSELRRSKPDETVADSSNDRLVEGYGEEAPSSGQGDDPAAWL